MIGDDDSGHLVVEAERELVAADVEDADEQGDRAGAAHSRQEVVEVREVEEDLRHREPRTCLELLLEALELVVEVVGGRVQRDTDEERRRRVDLAPVQVFACVHVRDDPRQADRVRPVTAGLVTDDGRDAVAAAFDVGPARFEGITILHGHIFPTRRTPHNGSLGPTPWSDRTRRWLDW